MSYLGETKSYKEKKSNRQKLKSFIAQVVEGSFNIHRKLFVPESEMRAPNRSRFVNLVKPASTKAEKSDIKYVSVKA